MGRRARNAELPNKDLGNAKICWWLRERFIHFENINGDVSCQWPKQCTAWCDPALVVLLLVEVNPLSFSSLMNNSGNLLETTMANAQQEYAPLDIEDPESESFLPGSQKVLPSRSRRAFERLLPLGWIVSLVLLMILGYKHFFPTKQTDLECTRQLNAWCK
jgi:hypothetical protein